MASRPYSCREVLDFLADYLEGALAVDVRAAFEHHLERCVDCRRYLDGYAETIRLGRDAHGADAPAPDDVPDELVAAILASRPAG